ncbi:antigen 5 like allergen Cul n 1 [Musca domestica]|uniref:Venom allergen 5 n=1 Tax=Musca domestica TaxID=7370 RepID=A0A1I8MWB8_MUSDO|nr:antigen 5 like allergen Cul n 1 [Musca domestica]
MLAFSKLCSIVVFLGIFNYCSATNYCDPDLCYGLEGHIGCNNNGQYAPTCYPDAKIVPIDEGLRNAIIRKHNEYRNLVASGFDRFAPASRMAKTHWNDELAQLAELNVKQCEAKHDLCRNTDEFNFAGQNIAVRYFWNNQFDAGLTALDQIDQWFDEYKLASMKDIREYRTPTDGTVIGSFTAMVQEMGTSMGCAILQQTGEKGIVQQILTCNYSYINIEGLPVYGIGVTASQCTTGPDATYPSLCSDNEVYEVNDIPHYRE